MTSMTNSVTPDMAGRKLSLWFFRDLTDHQRFKLFRLFGMPDAEITNQGYQAMALSHVVRLLSADPAPEANVLGDEPEERLAEAEWQAFQSARKQARVLGLTISAVDLLSIVRAASPSPKDHVEGPQPCGIADPSTRDCPNMKEVGGGMDGERYRCAVCGKGYFLD
nr:hypothetical protein REQ54_00802 [Rhizobium sp. Q54]CAD6412780.1 hypothetical protein REQ54_01062 [Rhizobium sp. Q54]